MRYFDDFQPGQTIELGTYPPLTEEEIIEFAQQWDPQYFHLDPVAAKESIFGGLVASGWHTGAIAMRLLVGNLVKDVAGQGSPGLEQVRFVKPVRPGDELSGRYIVLETELSASRPALGKLKSRCELRNQDGDVVFSMESWAFMSRRP
jgi:acyl dehydratase